MTKYLAGSLLGMGVVARYFQYVSQRQLDEDQEVINEVLFFPDLEYPCIAVTKNMATCPPEQRICLNPSCRKLHGREGEAPSSMIKFLDYLSRAKSKIDLCMYMFTQSTLASLLSDLHNAKVAVRIIVDCSEYEGPGSQIESLHKLGIEIKSNRRGTGALMHHKFVIVDGQILLSGSFNWTNKAVVSNYEAVVVTSNKSLVEPFVTKFDEMWTKFTEHPRKKQCH